ncbi:MAG TPA: redoxin family protein [Lacipirellulaceae bacterium]|jgi:alkyl hydroperoxide reductase subunit AhpC|nr:redoxin family protein [Lacipirellulaceae bacterium]
MRRFRAQLAAGVFILLTGSSFVASPGGSSCSADENHGSSIRDAKLPASLQLVDVDGRPFDLRKASKGRAHVVVFVRSDCPISNKMAPEVRELCTAFKSRETDIYLVYVDPRESAEAIRTHLHDYEYTCPAVRDMKHELATATGATVTPEAVVFDRDWKVVYRGRINNMFEDIGKSRDKATTHELRDAIDATLAGRAIAEPETKAIGCYIDDLK